MSLEKIQKVLALIYTDKIFREKFFADPPGVGSENGLNDEEITSLAALSLHKVTFFAASLQQKRLKQVYNFLPFLHKLLGKDFIPLFMDYADSYVPAGVKKYQDDALRFAAFVKNSGAQLKQKYPCLNDLAEYESAFIVAAEPGSRLLIRRFRYPIPEIIKQIHNNEIISPAKKKKLVIWLRLGRNGKLRQFIFP